jgi:hypothetical protein
MWGERLMKSRKEEPPDNAKAEKRRLRRDRFNLLRRRAKKDKSATPQFSRRRHRRWSGVGLLFVCFGAISFALSLIYDSSILAFIGLGLALWGGLFFFIKATKYVKVSVFDATIMSSLLAIDKTLTELNIQGQGVYFPPKDFKKKNVFVVVPLKGQRYMPKAETLAEGKVFLNSKGICLIPPGQGLMNLYEKELRKDFSKRDLNYLTNKLPKALIENLEILEDIEIKKQDEDIVYVKMKGTFHAGLCKQFRGYRGIARLGCPICSSLACALVKATDEAVTIKSNYISIDEKTTETWYQLIKWKS